MASFEEDLKGLEEIVAKLEAGEQSLEDSLKLFERGMDLSAACKKELEEAEAKVEVLVKQKNGTMKKEPFSG